MPQTTSKYWTHTSVTGFAGDRDPIEVMAQKCRALVIEAIESGWEGPPFDPFALAEFLKIPVVPRDDIRDARTVPTSHGARLQIEYNPNRPKARIRYSIAHEIAHTLFPDCRDRVRNRAAKNQMEGDDWQLEMLCNVGAAELLMPFETLQEVEQNTFSIDLVLQLREQFQVSTEAVLLRLVKLTRFPCAAFAASHQHPGSQRLSIDYTQPANGWQIPFRNGMEIPQSSVAHDCIAIGYTAKNTETWEDVVGSINVECVAVPSYPGADNPRVVGLLWPTQSEPKQYPAIKYFVGDATKPRGNGPRIIAHVVNDATPRWGGGFARVIGKHWPEMQADFVQWAEKHRASLRLGCHRLFQIDNELFAFSMIAQHGYGSSPRPRIRYTALETCLLELSRIAEERNATVHMPRIGCGQAGGNWAVVSEMLDTILSRKGVEVTIYDLPSERSHWTKPKQQRTLLDTWAK